MKVQLEIRLNIETDLRPIRNIPTISRSNCWQLFRLLWKLSLQLLWQCCCDCCGNCCRNCFGNCLVSTPAYNPFLCTAATNYHFLIFQYLYRLGQLLRSSRSTSYEALNRSVKPVRRFGKGRSFPHLTSASWIASRQRHAYSIRSAP